MSERPVSDPKHPIWLLLLIIPPGIIWYIVFRCVARKHLRRELKAVERWHAEKIRESETEPADPPAAGEEPDSSPSTAERHPDTPEHQP